MLKQRVITAILLLAILLPALFHPNVWPFNLLVLVLVTAGGWEWGRLNGLQPLGAVATAVVAALLCVATWQMGWLAQPHPVLWLLAGAAWVLGSACLVKAGVPGWAKIPFIVRWSAGVLALWVAGLAMVQARQMGVNFLLSILVLVWVADVFAYFAGRALGLRFTKVWGGALGVVALAFVWVALDRANQVQVLSFYSRVFDRGWWLLLLAALFMAAMSVVGDLVESLIKRSAGVKDSSQLLPGHGGVLDRIDALLPTLPLAMMLTSLVQ